MVMKRHNSLALDYPLDGLPTDWRRRAEDTVRHVGKLFDLYVTTVKAGSSSNPPRILISIAREGAEAAWTDEAQTALRERIVKTLDWSKEEEVARKAQLAEMEADFAAGVAIARRGHRLIPAKERDRDAASARALAKQRMVIQGELRAKLAGANLDPSARDLAKLALDRMKQSERWALWAQLLLAVDVTAEAIGDDLEKRIRGLL